MFEVSLSLRAGYNTLGTSLPDAAAFSSVINACRAGLAETLRLRLS